MNLDLKSSFILTLTNVEFNLVSKALRGVLKGEEEDAAKELQREMMKHRIQKISDLSKQIEKLKSNMEGDE